MDTQDITLLRTLCEAGSITRAAELLFMSQPTLSKKLARLESRLAAKLFHRAATGLVPTDVTRYIVESAAPIDSQLRRIERHVQQITELDTGEVRLGVGPIIEQVLMPDVLTRFVAETGQVQVSIVTDQASRLLQQLHHSDLDLIAGPFLIANHPDLAGATLIRDHLVTVARADHPIFSGEDDVDAFPFAAPLPQGLSVPANRSSAGTGKRIASDNYPLLKKLVLASDSLCRGPWHVFREELAEGTLREVTGAETILWQSAVLTHPESAEMPLVRRMMALLVAACDDYWAQRGRAPSLCP